MNTSGEPSKYGVEPAEAVPLCQHVDQKCKHLKFAGLMTIGQPDYTSRPENFEVCRCPGLRMSINANPPIMVLAGPQSSRLLHNAPQCLSGLREEVSKELGIAAEDIELSMGMSGDFEQAVSAQSGRWCGVACHVTCIRLADCRCLSGRKFKQPAGGS